MKRDPIQIELERPDEYQEVGDEVYCWVPGNFDRECNGSCVAFDIIFEEDQRRSQCSIINMFKSVAMSHARIANVAQAKEKAAQERARAAAVPNQPPPEVR